VALGVEDEVVVLAGLVVGWLGRQFTGHTEVDAQPAVGAEAEEHLFPVGLDGPQILSPQGGLQLGGIDSPKNPFLPVQVNVDDLSTKGWSPATTEVEDLGQLRHTGKLWSFAKLSKIAP
jgi:hypothetical protein